MTKRALSLGIIAAVGLFACGDQGAGSTGPAATADKSAPPPAASSAALAKPSSAPTDSSLVIEGSAAPSSAPSAAASSSSAPSTSAVATTGPAPTATAAASVVGEKTNAPAYSAFLSAARSYKAGKPGAVTVVVTAAEGYHVNPNFPYKMKLNAPPAGISFPADTVRDVARTEKTATMTIPFNADAAGTGTISGMCSLSVCTAENCVVDKVPLSVTVKVE